MDLKLQKALCCILDLDGTLYLDDRLIEGSAAAVRRMRAADKRVLFLTNNSSVSRSAYQKKLNRLGIEATNDEIFTSGTATIGWLRAHSEFSRVFVLGTDDLKNEFVENNIVLDDNKPLLVVVAFDTGLCYDNLTAACNFIREGVPYIATHPDINCPTARGYKPDVGAFLALIEASTGVLPLAICGKPFSPCADAIVSLLGCRNEDVAMFGDRLSTDMRFAVDNGFVSALVLSGETTKADLAASDIKPDIILKSIADWDK